MELITRPEDLFGIAIAGVVVALLVLLAIAGFLWRRFVPLTPIPLGREDWMRFEQRRWTNPGETLRVLLSFGVGVVCVGVTIAGPWWLGVAQSPGWYLNWWWIGAFFGAFAVSAVGAWLITGRAKHRCRRCLSEDMVRAMPRAGDELIYVCSPCQIVWRTGLSTRPSSHHVDHHFH